jgi:uncharacterized protein Yka (UPF0111/DUF47 family)
MLSKDSVFKWTEEHDRALDNLKQALLSDVVLVYPNFDDEFTVITDASLRAAAHMLCQFKDNKL